MRDKVEMILTTISEIPDNIYQKDRITLENKISNEVEELQNDIASDYSDIMARVANFVQDVMGEPPCDFSLAGMGSLARHEITPYSDFENMILIETTSGEYEHMTNYFRWYSVIFQVVLINLGETIIPSVSIYSLNDHNIENGDWFYDMFTTRGICFDGMMPHACKFPLGRIQPTKNKPWKTELIKPVNEMLKYLNSEESFKNGYHLSTILTKTCHIYGSIKVFEDFETGVHDLIENEQMENIQESVMNQVTEDLAKFATRQALAEMNTRKQINIKCLIYRNISSLISEMGRFYKITSNSSFEILKDLANKRHISENMNQKLRFAIALACQVRLKWYSLNKQQNDNINSIDIFFNLIGKQATVSYFRIAYALQCDISKRLNLKKLHLYSTPKLLNVCLEHCFREYNHIQDVLQNNSQMNITKIIVK